MFNRLVVKLFAVLFFTGTCVSINAQNYSVTNLSDHEGLFGIFGGFVLSHLDQPLSEGYLDHKRLYHQGYEAGIKLEMYRSNFIRGNTTVSYQQTGSSEWYQNGDQWEQMDVNLQSIRLSINPLMLKSPGDFFHVYAGGGFYGSYIFKQDFVNPHPDFIRNESNEIDNKDIGLNAMVGMRVWNFEVELQAGYGFLDLTTRADETVARQRYYSANISFLLDKVIRERKSCKDKRQLTRLKKRRG